MQELFNYPLSIIRFSHFIEQGFDAFNIGASLGLFLFDRPETLVEQGDEQLVDVNVGIVAVGIEFVGNRIEGFFHRADFRPQSAHLHQPAADENQRGQNRKPIL